MTSQESEPCLLILPTDELDREQITEELFSAAVITALVGQWAASQHASLGDPTESWPRSIVLDKN